MNEQDRTAKRLRSSVAAVVILSVCLCITTFALFFPVVAAGDNVFQTGRVEINLNDGRPVIEEQEFLFEPGMTVEKDFFIENHSTWDVYYKIYFTNIEGSLSDILDVTIKQSDTVLFTGKVSDLTREKVGAADDILRLNERRNLKMVFHFPEEAEKEAQNLYLTFDIGADAVQTKNNPNGLFK